MDLPKNRRWWNGRRISQVFNTIMNTTRKGGSGKDGERLSQRERKKGRREREREIERGERKGRRINKVYQLHKLYAFPSFSSLFPSIAASLSSSHRGHRHSNIVIVYFNNFYSIFICTQILNQFLCCHSLNIFPFATSLVALFFGLGMRRKNYTKR